MDSIASETPAPASAPHHEGPAERAAAGKRARADVPRSSHGEWEPAADRPDPAELMRAEDRTRVAELLPLRYERMLASPFSFYRGSAALMAADLAPTPVSGFRAQLCGDAHLSNFGAFAAADRRLIFDINDFDETLPGPWEWDVKRLAASFEIAGRDRGFDRGERRRVVAAAARAYRENIRRLAGSGNLAVWYERTDVESIRTAFTGKLRREDERSLERNVAKADRKDSRRALSRLAEERDGELRLIADPPLMVPIEDLAEGAGLEEIRERLTVIFGTYKATLPDHIRHLAERFTYVHAARKVVGVGSVGSRAWVALLIGRDSSDPLFLQIKEAGPSALEPYAGPSRYEHPGRRVVEGQRLIQASADIMLGWMEADAPDGEHRRFYVRQLWDKKGSARTDAMSPDAMHRYASLCGAVLARAHARTGDAIAIGSYLGGGDRFDRSMVGFADAYADQNDRDHAALVAAVARGEIDAGVAPAGATPA